MPDNFYQASNKSASEYQDAQLQEMSEHSNPMNEGILEDQGELSQLNEDDQFNMLENMGIKS